MRTETLHDLFLEELADIYYAEKRIAKEFPKMAKAATCTDLRTTIEDNLKEIDSRVRKLEEVFHAFGERVVGKTCQATKGLLAESDEIAEVFKDSPAINAALIGAAQKIAHYKIASYGCLREWAELLGNRKAASILGDNLTGEKAANDVLTRLAVTKSNKDALRKSISWNGNEGTEYAVELSPRIRALTVASVN